MSRIENLREVHSLELNKCCESNGISVNSLKKLLDAEKTKKLLKRNALIQQTIDREIDKAIEDEN